MREPQAISFFWHLRAHRYTLIYLIFSTSLPKERKRTLPFQTKFAQTIRRNFLKQAVASAEHRPANWPGAD
jgi:hypothetical protein